MNRFNRRLPILAIKSAPASRRPISPEATVPDAFRKAPKIISPGVHAWLDVAVTGYFAVLGTIFAVRGKVGPAIAAFVNAGMVGGVSAFTDYNGSGKKPINFKLHGTLDAAQATTAALAPVLHGFADEAESAFFYGQAANELAVIASTDWDVGMARKEAPQSSVGLQQILKRQGDALPFFVLI